MTNENVIIQLAGFFLSLAGMVGMVALLILNMKVQTAVAKVQLDIASVRTEFFKEQGGLYKEVMKGIQEAAKEQSSLYREVVSGMQNAYMNRSESLQMHQENKDRLSQLETEFNAIRVLMAERIRAIPNQTS